MAALEFVSGRTTAPGATITTLTPSLGNSFTVRFAAPDAEVRLLSPWAQVQGAGTFRIRSPQLHDNTEGIRLGTGVDIPIPLLPLALRQRLIPQDALTVELSGSAVGGDIELAGMHFYYNNLPGIDADLRSPADVLPNIEQISGVAQNLTADASGDYSGEQAINADADTFKANRFYAILGAVVQQSAATPENLAIRIRAAAWGNLGVAIPLPEANPEISRGWFIDLSNAQDLPLIPVFNSAARANVLVDIIANENGGAISINLILGLLTL